MAPDNDLRHQLLHKAVQQLLSRWLAAAAVLLPHLLLLLGHCIKNF
jgi:hypothetical protein